MKLTRARRRRAFLAMIAVAGFATVAALWMGQWSQAAVSCLFVIVLLNEVRHLQVEIFMEATVQRLQTGQQYAEANTAVMKQILLAMGVDVDKP